MADRAVVVTGASGFVGEWLLAALRRRLPDTPIIGTSTSAQNFGTQLDVTKENEVDAVISRLRPRAVVNLAALSFVPAAESDPEAAYAINLFGPLNLARSILRHVPDCRFVFVGSSEVYGLSFRDTDRPLDETAPLRPTNIYAASKAAADLLMGQYALRGLQVVRFRPFNHFGPGQSSRFVVPSFVEQIVAAEAAGKPATIKVGNINSQRDFLDVRDVVSAYVSAIVRPEPLPPGTVLNLASGVPRSISSIIDELVAHARVKISVEQTAARARAIDVPRAIGDPAQVRQLLGWQPAYAFGDTLREVVTLAREAAHTQPATTAGHSHVQRSL